MHDSALDIARIDWHVIDLSLTSALPPIVVPLWFPLLDRARRPIPLVGGADQPFYFQVRLPSGQCLTSASAWLTEMEERAGTWRQKIGAQVIRTPSVQVYDADPAQIRVVGYMDRAPDKPLPVGVLFTLGLGTR